MTGRARVVVLDDDVHFGASVVRMLGRFGYDAHLVDDIDVCLDHIERNVPALLLTDLALIGGSAHDVVKTVRRRQPDLPIIAMSGGGGVADVVHLFRAGVCDYLIKPFDAEELRRTMLRSLGAATELGPAPQAAPAPRDLPLLLDRLRHGRVPSPPAGVAELLDLRHSTNASTAQVSAAVGRDAALAAGVLRLANRANMLAAKPAASVQEACSRLGSRRVLDLSQQLLLEGFVPVQAQGLGDAARAAWAHTLRAAELARAAALEGGAVDPEDAFLATLLHNLGELVLLAVAAELGSEGVPTDLLLEALIEQCPGDHEAAGEIAARAWGLPRELAAIITRHHQDPSRIRAPMRAAVVFGAEGARGLGLVYFGNQGTDRDEAVSTARVVGERIGLDRPTVDRWLEAEG